MANFGISGLATGMDVDALIAKSMAAQRMPVNKLLQDKQILEWQRESYQAVNNSIRDYRDNKLSVSRLEGTFSAKKVDINGNATAVSARATGDAMNSTLMIEVNSIATAATQYSASSILSGTEF